jgi:FixJ family two-component response regulator
MRISALFDDSDLRQAVAKAEIDAVNKINSLSPREKQILEHITDGKLNKEAAAALGISIRTIENHRAALIEKTGVKTFAELVRLSILAGEP